MCIVPAENHYLTIWYRDNGSGHYILQTKKDPAGCWGCLVMPLLHLPFAPIVSVCLLIKETVVCFCLQAAVCVWHFQIKDEKLLYIYVSHQHCRDLYDLKGY